jgi:hypothetical protein
MLGFDCISFIITFDVAKGFRWLKSDICTGDPRKHGLVSENNYADKTSRYARMCDILVAGVMQSG